MLPDGPGARSAEGLETRDALDAIVVHPPDFSEDERSGPPLGACHVAESAREKGFRVVVFDLNANSVVGQAKRVLRKGTSREFSKLLASRLALANRSPPVVGLSATAVNVEGSTLVASKLADTFPASLLVAGGYCSLDPAPLFGAGVRVVVRGEGEAVFPRILSVVLEGRALQETLDGLARLPGLLVKNLDGSISEGPPARPLADLDAVPQPRFSSLGVNLSDYGYEATGWVYAQRGCHNACKFCDVSTFYGKRGVRSPSPGVVATWLRRLHEEEGVEFVQFNDDNFLNHRGWLESLCERLDELEVPVKINFQTRTPDVLRHREELERCKERVYQVELGVESFSQSQLDRWGKRVKVGQNLEALSLLSGLGIPHLAYFILGDAETTREELAATLLQIPALPPVPVVPGGPTLPAVLCHVDFNFVLDVRGNSSVECVPWLRAVDEFLDGTADLVESSSLAAAAIVQVVDAGSSAVDSRSNADVGNLFRGFVDLASKLALERLELALKVADAHVDGDGRGARRKVDRLVKSWKENATRLLEALRGLPGLELGLVPGRATTGLARRRSRRGRLKWE
ncbi:MAG: hypothetical protein Kow0069_32310 [Promethearchaeota archaeon]